MTTQRRLIGYWRDDLHPEYPDPDDLVDESWDENERHVVWAYTASGTMAMAFGGLSPCRQCGQPNGGLELTDGVYQWPDGLAHYVDEHAVRLPQEFVDHVYSRLDALDAGTTDLAWWLKETAPKAD